MRKHGPRQLHLERACRRPIGPHHSGSSLRQGRHSGKQAIHNGELMFYPSTGIWFDTQ